MSQVEPSSSLPPVPPSSTVALGGSDEPDDAYARLVETIQYCLSLTMRDLAAGGSPNSEELFRYIVDAITEVGPERARPLLPGLVAQLDEAFRGYCDQLELERSLARPARYSPFLHRPEDDIGLLARNVIAYGEVLKALQCAHDALERPL